MLEKFSGRTILIQPKPRWQNEEKDRASNDGDGPGSIPAHGGDGKGAALFHRDDCPAGAGSFFLHVWFSSETDKVIG
jgi:hypothetical protein